MKQLLCALAAFVAFAATAAAQQIKVAGYGEAQADTQRIVVQLMILNSTGDAATTQARFDGVKALIKQTDPTAADVTDRPADPGDEASIVNMFATSPHLRMEIAAATASRVAQVVGGFGMSVLYTPVAANRPALRDQALHAALDDARQSAQRIAAAAGWHLGAMNSVEQSTRNLSNSGGQPSPKVIVRETVTATFDAAP